MNHICNQKTGSIPSLANFLSVVITESAPNSKPVAAIIVSKWEPLDVAALASFAARLSTSGVNGRILLRDHRSHSRVDFGPRLVAVPM